MATKIKPLIRLRTPPVAPVAPVAPVVPVAPVAPIAPNVSVKPASAEQRHIVELVQANNNVRVIAVAGAGKTTTVLHIALAMPEKQILLVTYNRRLKDESSIRAREAQAYNLNVETYHSCASKLYKYVSTNHNDTLMEIISRDIPTSQTYDLIVIDEIQDMTDLLYQLTKKIIRDTLSPGAGIVVLGDPHQCIYRSVGADPRYLTEAHSKFDRKFVDATLSTSYRVTRQIASFVNASIGLDRIKTAKDGSNIVYLAGDTFSASGIVFDMLNRLLRSGTYDVDDIFILAYSVKKNEGREKPVHKLENMLVKANYKVYRPLDDNQNINQDDVKGKICISSFHQSKGRERKIVVVYGHDDTYFKFSGRENDVSDGLVDPYICPNEVYVATTRAQERLIVVGSSVLPPWLRRVPKDVDVIGSCYWKSYKSSTPKPKTTTPIDLIRFIPDAVLLKVKSMVDSITASTGCGRSVSLTSTLNLGETTESVSDITGLAISAMYETRCTKDQPTIHRNLKNPKILKCVTVSDYLQTAVEYESSVSGYLNRLRQITRYNWLTSEQCETMIGNISLHVGTGLKFEVPYQVTHDSLYGPVTVSGRVDILSKDTIYELKATEDLTLEHKLQAIIYGWMFRDPHMKIKLVNARTGECLDIVNDMLVINDIVNTLLDAKYGSAVASAVAISESPFSKCML